MKSKTAPRKEKSKLQLARIEWKKRIEGKSKAEVFEIENAFVGKAYSITTGKKEKRIEVYHLNPGGLLVANVITGLEYRLPPWHLLDAREIKKKCFCQINTGREQPERLRQEYYQLIWKNWKNYLAAEKPNFKTLGEAVNEARRKMTEKFCIFYDGTPSAKIWHESLNDLSRKMHDSYVPVNGSGEELWDAAKSITR